MPIETGNDENEASSAEAEEAALFGSWQIDQRTGRFNWSDEVFRIFGVDPQTFTPSYEAVLARAHPEDRARLGKAYADAVAALAGEKSDEVLSIEHRIVLDDGSIKFVHERGRMVYDEKGHPVRSIGIVLDVTGQKKLENELRDAKAAFIEAQSVAQVGSWQWNIQNGHVTWSDECFRILGLDPATFAPSFDAYLARVHPDDRDTLVSNHQAVIGEIASPVLWTSASFVTTARSASSSRDGRIFTAVTASRCAQVARSRTLRNARMQKMH